MTISDLIARYPRAAALVAVVVCRYINLLFHAAEHIEKHRVGAQSCKDILTTDPTLLAVCATHSSEYNRRVPIEAMRLMFSPARHLADASESLLAITFLGAVVVAVVMFAMNATSAVAHRLTAAPAPRAVHVYPASSFTHGDLGCTVIDDGGGGLPTALLRRRH